MAAFAEPYFPLLDQYLIKVAPWHRFVTGPGFPKFPLFTSDPTFTQEKIVEVVQRFDDDFYKIPSSIFTTTDQGNVAGWEVSFDDTNKIVTLDLSKNGVKELTIREWFDTSNVNIIDTVYHGGSGKNCQIRVAGGTWPTMTVEIDINGKKLAGNCDLGQMEVPQIAIDLAGELDTMMSTATLAAMNQSMLAMVSAANWANGSCPTFLSGSGRISWNALGTVLSDVLGAPGGPVGGAVSAGYAAVCGILIYRVETGHW